MKDESKTGGRLEVFGRRDLIAMLGGAATAWTLVAWAQSPGKRALIGYLSAGGQSAADPFTAPFLAGMRDLGYVEGRNFDIAYRFANDDPQRLIAQADELVSLKPDVIIVEDPTAASAAKKSTSSIPIVGMILIDPVKQGLVASYARPGGNVTGVLVVVEGMWGKNLEILREVVPNASTIGVLFNPVNPGNAAIQQEIVSVGAATGVRIVTAGAAVAGEVEPAFKTLLTAGAQAVMVIGDAVFYSERVRIAQLATVAHLPTISNPRWFAEAGGLMSYGVSLPANSQRAAYFVDRILKGAKPADLPVELPTKIEMVLNMKTAKALGIAIPPSILLRADDEIE